MNKRWCDSTFPADEFVGAKIVWEILCIPGTLNASQQKHFKITFSSIKHPNSNCALKQTTHFRLVPESKQHAPSKDISKRVISLCFCGFPKNNNCQVMQLDNRGSHFYLALFWAEARFFFLPYVFHRSRVLGRCGGFPKFGQMHRRLWNKLLVKCLVVRTRGIPGNERIH